MTMLANYKTKKSLKESVGDELNYTETSMFGEEYPANGTGCVTVVGPSATNRKWFASVEVFENKIVKVK